MYAVTGVKTTSMRIHIQMYYSIQRSDTNIDLRTSVVSVLTPATHGVCAHISTDAHYTITDTAGLRPGSLGGLR